MAIQIKTDVTLNGQKIEVTAFEDTDSDGTAENQETASVPDGITNITLASLEGDSGYTYWFQIDLETADAATTPTVNSLSVSDFNPSVTTTATTDTTLNGETVRIQVREDTDADGAIEQAANFIPAGGSGEETQLSGLDFPNNEYEISVDLETSDTSTTPTVDRISLKSTSTVQYIGAQAATISSAPQNAGRVFDSTTLSGTVTLNGSGVDGATIYCIDTTNQDVAEVTTTDANGDYRVRVDTGDLYHMVVQYEDDQGNQYNDESKPFLAT
jgi:hypothetical protein